MDKVILIRIGEIYLKGKNRCFFENTLIRNIKEKLGGIECKLFFGRNRYEVSEYNQADEVKIVALLKTVFGINSLSCGYKVASDYSEISKLVKAIVPQSGSFRVSANRADKSFPLDSMKLSRELGGDLLDEFGGLTVDLHSPDFTVNVDIRENGVTYVFSDKIIGAGGMPVGTAGRGLLLLSGGIDSPVAGYMMAKRGLSLSALHFHSYPYTSESAQQKVKELAKIMQDHCGKINLIFAPFTKIQETIHKCCDDNFMITIMRRFMMKIAERTARKFYCDCLVNGESLGQVASQTVQSITVTNSVIKELPVMRPLIGMDKQEIMEISKKIGTYETSVLPYEDCCTVFLPKNPVTKPQIERCEFEESKIENGDDLIEEVLNNLEIVEID